MTTAAFAAVLADAGIRLVKSDVRLPRMNSIVERWIQTWRRELVDRTLSGTHTTLCTARYELFRREVRD
jgi:putative transposase